MEATGDFEEMVVMVSGRDGVLRGRLERGGAGVDVTLAFYRDEYVVSDRAGSSAPPGSERANFVRGADGNRPHPYHQLTFSAVSSSAGSWCGASQISVP